MTLPRDRPRARNEELKGLDVAVADVVACFTKWDATADVALDVNTIDALHDLVDEWKRHRKTLTTRESRSPDGENATETNDSADVKKHMHDDETPAVIPIKPMADAFPRPAEVADGHTTSVPNVEDFGHSHTAPVGPSEPADSLHPSRCNRFLSTQCARPTGHAGSHVGDEALQWIDTLQTDLETAKQVIATQIAAAEAFIQESEGFAAQVAAIEQEKAENESGYTFRALVKRAEAAEAQITALEQEMGEQPYGKMRRALILRAEQAEAQVAALTVQLEELTMPKVTFGVHHGGRIRLELNYDDYKAWERILGAAATESTTLVEGDRYWKALLVVVGGTEYRFSGPVMTSREDE